MSLLKLSRINFNFDLEQVSDQKVLLEKYFLIIDDLTKEIEEINLNQDSDNTKTRYLDFVKLSPPRGIYTNAINPNKVEIRRNGTFSKINPI